jgi:hypothetical protein
MLPSVVVSGENLARQTDRQAQCADDMHEVETIASHSGKSQAMRPSYGSLRARNRQRVPDIAGPHKHNGG